MRAKTIASFLLLAASATTSFARPVNVDLTAREILEPTRPMGEGEIKITSTTSTSEPSAPQPSQSAPAPSAPSTVPGQNPTQPQPTDGRVQTTSTGTTTVPGQTTTAPPAAPPAGGQAMPGTIPGPTAGSAAAPNAGDLFILNYALTLEHLESAFYAQALQKFSENDFRAAGIDPAIRTQMQVIQSHEQTHVTTLTSVIESTFGKGQAVPPCEYNFPLDNVGSFVAIAAALERTGVQAYDGAIKFVTADAVKTAGAAIATIEGRHASLLNAVNTQKVNVNGAQITANINPIPAPFDTPLGFTPVFSIAAPLIKACPFALPVQPFPSLTLSRTTGNLRDNIGLLFSAALNDQQLNTSGALQCNFLFGLQQKRTPVTVSRDPRTGGLLADCDVPIEAQGFEELVVFVVSQDADVTLDNDRHVLAGPSTFQILEQTLVKVAAQ